MKFKKNDIIKLKGKTYRVCFAGERTISFGYNDDTVLPVYDLAPISANGEANLGRTFQYGDEGANWTSQNTDGAVLVGKTIGKPRFVVKYYKGSKKK